MDKEIINKDGVTSVDDIGFIEDNVIDYPDATMLSKFTKPSGNGIIDNPSGDEVS
jgi:hypothetical protein